MAEAVKTIVQGALGAMSFGAYHQFTTNKMMELNNDKLNAEHKYNLDRIENEHKQQLESIEKKYQTEMNELNIKLNQIIEKQKSRWF